MDKLTKTMGDATVVIDPATGNPTTNVQRANGEELTAKEREERLQREAEFAYRLVEGEPS